MNMIVLGSFIAETSVVEIDSLMHALELVRLRRSGSGSSVQEGVQLGQGRGVFGIVVDEVSHRTS